MPNNHKNVARSYYITSVHSVRKILYNANANTRSDPRNAHVIYAQRTHSTCYTRDKNHEVHPKIFILSRARVALSNTHTHGRRKNFNISRSCGFTSYASHFWLMLTLLLYIKNAHAPRRAHIIRTSRLPIHHFDNTCKRWEEFSIKSYCSACIYFFSNSYINNSTWKKIVHVYNTVFVF